MLAKRNKTAEKIPVAFILWESRGKAGYGGDRKSAPWTEFVLHM